MVTRGAPWTTNIWPRWFVRVAAVCVGLANLVGMVLWFVGGLYLMVGEDASSWREIIWFVVATLIASLTSS